MRHLTKPLALLAIIGGVAGVALLAFMQDTIIRDVQLVKLSWHLVKLDDDDPLVRLSLDYDRWYHSMRRKRVTLDEGLAQRRLLVDRLIEQFPPGDTGVYRVSISDLLGQLYDDDEIRLNLPY